MAENKIVTVEAAMTGNKNSGCGSRVTGNKIVGVEAAWSKAN